MKKGRGPKTLEDMLKNIDLTKPSAPRPPTDIRPGRCGGCDLRMDPLMG
ncbi:hypothetical protein KJ763_02810 [Patescibacteria group bacterium]|nr:hypothetical protein [Patescibacteria group bacterium]